MKMSSVTATDLGQMWCNCLITLIAGGKFSITKSGEKTVKLEKWICLVADCNRISPGLRRLGKELSCLLKTSATIPQHTETPLRRDRNVDVSDSLEGYMKRGKR